ncbi:MAG: dephospho-CoA kinase [Thiobacillus sp.]|nr:dephospho-CoA kinase [Thiobacillus sp.]
MFVVGLTGGIGSGKSAVAERFARLGVPVIDTDVIARELTAPGGVALPAIRARFGDGVFDPAGALDRAALRRRVFQDAGERATLESILHPLIRQEVERQIAAASAPYCLLVVPLLVETGAYRDIVRRVLVVECPEATRVVRVMARSGLSREEVEAIVAAQASDAARRAAADDVIVNTGALDVLDGAVARLHARYLALAESAPRL